MTVADFKDFLEIAPDHGALCFYVPDLENRLLRVGVCEVKYIEESNVLVLYDYKGLNGHGVSIKKTLEIMKDIPQDATVVTGEETIHENGENIVKFVIPGLGHFGYVFDQRLLDRGKGYDRCIRRIQYTKKYEDFVELCKSKGIDIGE